jgi:hypothetical protein
MPIEFTCPGCTSRHAFADHMAGRQFRCNGCGKILTVPASSGEAITERPRPQPTDPDANYAEAEERAPAMGTGLQVALLVIGSVLLVLMLGFCLGFGFWMPGRMAEPGPVIEEVVKEPPPVERPPDIEDPGQRIKLKVEEKK